jgi:hypothetical protein
MPTKWKNTKTTENVGLLFIAEVINNSKCILNKIDGSNDIGLDAYLEFVERESATGLCIGIQVKSGNSYQTSDKSQAVFKADKEHFEYWQSHTLPIAGLVYIPEDNNVYWVDITEYLNNDPNIVISGPYNIKVSKESVFNHQFFESFYKKFLSYKTSFNEEWNLGRALKGIVNFKPKNERIDAFKSLFYFHRDSKEMWYYILQQFKIEVDLETESLLIYLMRHLTSHGDIFWHKGNIISADVRSYGCSIIADTYGTLEVAKLLRHIDENGVSRGSIGQNIYRLLDLIPGKYEALKKIILDCKTEEDQRFWAAVIIINDFQYRDLERATNFAESMITNFPNSENLDRYKIIKQTLIEFGYVDFEG